ncbi:unnamed protein product [Choristocarpus tenellus]
MPCSKKLYTLICTSMACLGECWGSSGPSINKNSHVSVRCGERISGTVKLERGVTQVCTLSPVLFNIFINDLFDGTERFGMRCPKTLETVRISGLKFADDATALTPSGSKMLKMQGHLPGWTVANEMFVGLHKCGLMADLLRETPDRWRLCGQQLPLVEVYQNLRIDFHRLLDIPLMLEPRLKSANRLIGAVHPFLSNKSILLSMKVAVVRGVVHPTLRFRSEVYGTNKVITQRK